MTVQSISLMFVVVNTAFAALNFAAFHWGSARRANLYVGWFCAFAAAVNIPDVFK